jgi:hypothetical protein
MRRGLVTFVSCGLALFLTLAGAQAQAAPPSPLPLLHASGSELFCAVAFPAIPGSQRCVDLAFADTDLWVFRDGSALAVATYESAGLAQVGGTPLSVTVERGNLPAATFASLIEALGALGIGSASGECNPFPRPPGLPAAFPETDFRYSIVWFGRGFRHNVIDLGTRFTDTCPVAVRDLLTTLLFTIPLAIKP